SRFRASNRRSMMHTKKKKRMVNKIQKWEKTNIVIMLDSTTTKFRQKLDAPDVLMCFKKLAEPLEITGKVWYNRHYCWCVRATIIVGVSRLSKDSKKVSQTIYTNLAVFQPMSLFGLVPLTSLPGLLRASPLS
ncbi:MAG: hypothetical protein FWE95_09695, partial [Planctomycetaceae bacterium]|nr:hypothetical protein [Planctomycetaceae bacterium]